MSSSTSTRLGSATGWCAGLGASGALVTWAGRAGLGLPSFQQLADPVEWMELVGPATAAMVGVRVFAILIIAWLTFVTVLALGARLLGWGDRALATLSRFAPAAAAPALAAIVGVSLVGGLAARQDDGGAEPGPDDHEPGTAWVVDLGPDPVDDPPSPDGDADDSPASHRSVGPATENSWRLLAAEAARNGPTESPVANRGQRTRSVEAGTHLWGISSEVLEDALGREVSDEEVTPYWLATVEANRPFLVDPDNPDLLIPGQTIVLPAPETYFPDE